MCHAHSARPRVEASATVAVMPACRVRPPGGTRLTPLLACWLLVLGGCAPAIVGPNGSEPAQAAEPATEEASVPEPTAAGPDPAIPSEATELAKPDTGPEATSTPESTAEATPTAVAQPTAASEFRCLTIANFESDQANAKWLVVNDDVMGGRSFGDRSFSDQTMAFTGTIDTDGGGFSSLRLPLAEGALTGFDRVLFRARSDGRSYRLTFADGLDNRNRRVSFRAPLEFTTAGAWETVTVYLDALVAEVFGQPVAADPFVPELATRIGIMLSDGVDGEFNLEVDHIQACAPASSPTP